MKVKILFPILVVAIISVFTLWVTKGIDHSISEQMAYEILHKQPPQELKSYCLKSVAGKIPSSTLISKLSKVGVNPRLCSGDIIWSVNISQFERRGFNKVTASYSYHCGELCSGLSECILKERSGGKVELQGCKLKWAS